MDIIQEENYFNRLYFILYAQFKYSFIQIFILFQVFFSFLSPNSSILIKKQNKTHSLMYARMTITVRRKAQVEVMSTAFTETIKHENVIHTEMMYHFWEERLI